MAASSSTASPASTSVRSNANQWFDVFINNCDDLGKTFAMSLYNRLCSNELRAFLKEDKLQLECEFPPQIKHAIGTASAHVAIFSTRYADSKWCLNELLLMLESKAPIVPVFYGVTPAEVRWTQRGKNGNYARALQNHEDNLPNHSRTIENWRNALSHVADISGFELEARNIGEELIELELLDKVVKRLSEMLKKPDLPVADYPTGLDEKLRDFEETVLLQQQQSGKPQILAIVGSGGVGKTTFAKHFFNRKKPDYRRFCFLFDVADNAAKNSLNSLQTKLLQSLTGLEKRIYSVDEGKGVLIEPLKSPNVLIILDDVDDMNQLDALVPVQSDLGSGSLILITSRDKNVLRNSRVENSSIYTLTGLNAQYSRELFCSHAFGQAFSLPEFKRLVDMFIVSCDGLPLSLVYAFIASCDGLPLSLKALGAHLYGKDKFEWYDDLFSLQQILPSISEVEKTFRISYKSLNREEQQIFLDVSCYFMEQNSDTAISIWNKSGWEGKQGLQTLEDKFLVEVDRWNVIHMREHLGYWGRVVAEQSSPLRLCRTESVIANLLQQSSGQVIPVRGIKIHPNRFTDEDDVSRAMRMMTRLRLVDFEGTLLEAISRRVDLANTGSNIFWFRSIGCPFSSLPVWVSTKNLRYLEVSRSKLKTLWHNESESQVPLQLPLDLEELRVDGCVLLKSIKGLEQLTKLRILNVSGCSDLEELPSIETLVYLERLLAEGCVKLQSIKGLERATKVSLEKLSVSGCVKVKSILGLERATKLLDLNVSWCSGLEELPSMETLTCLELLNAEGCVKLKRIRGLAQLTKLEELKVSGCSELEELTGMENLASLKVFAADRCVKLKSIHGLWQCKKLRTLLVSGFFELEELRRLVGEMNGIMINALSDCDCSNEERVSAVLIKQE